MTDKKVFELDETISTWDEDYYHPIAERQYDRAIADLLSEMGAKPGDAVLDAGCGPGVHSIRVAQYGCDVTAIDFSKTMLQEAWLRARAAGVGDRIKFGLDDLTCLSLPDNSFQYVFSWGVLVHIPNVEKALVHLARVTAPNGFLAVQISNRTAADHLIETLFRFLLRKPLKKQKLQFGEGIKYGLTGEELWVWHFDTEAVTRAICELGFRRVNRFCGEYTEIHRRVPEPFRSFLLWLNRFAYLIRAPARFSCTQVLIFQKQK